MHRKIPEKRNTMDNHALLAVSPIDGRYARQTAPLREYFSEYALIRYRVRVEIEYFIALCEIPLPQLADFDRSKFDALRDIYRSLTPEEAARVKDIEKVTNHDVKAVEYFIKERFKELHIEKWGEFVHFGLTSQDINNTSVPLSLKEAMENAFLPLVNEVLDTIKSMAGQWKDIPMLAKTHGQPASPTRLGKEFKVFQVRIEEQLRQLSLLSYPAKFGGATGNMNAHKVAYPGIDWISFGDRFVASLGLKRSFPTTQIEHYDNLAAIFDNVRRINTILIDFCRDIWTYISMEYFHQKVNKNEVGSSAMPHKVNPIDFENAEGNLGVADATAILQKLRMGALIVFERQTKLGEIAETGTVVEAEPSSQLIANIFFNKAPLHDGAMIIRDGSIYAAGCILPLTSNDNVSAELGTRHRAALGMSENSDAVVVVVSEETGQISVAMEGKLTRNYNRVTLREVLESALIGAPEETSSKRILGKLGLTGRTTRKGE